MDILENATKEQIQDFVEQKESKTSLGQIEENLEELGVDVQISHWLKNDEKMLNYAKLYLKDNKNIMEGLKIQFLELRVSVTCPYFEDFKIFLDELKKGEDTSKNGESGDSINTGENQNNIDLVGVDHDFLGTDIHNIISQPFYKNPGTGGTRCAATARFNGLNFGLKLPSGDAYTAGSKTPHISEYKATIPESKKNQKPKSSWSSIDLDKFKNIQNKNGEINFADIYLNSSSEYGHRAVAFKDDDGERYVLDPYTRVKGTLNNKPKKLSDYISNKKIVKSNFYHSSGYRFESRNYA